MSTVQMTGKKLSEETRRKMSESRKGKYVGEKSPNFGKHPSEETRRKLSAATKGEKNPNFGKHPIPWNKGIPHTEETRRKISQELKGKYVGECSPNFGRHRTLETRRKLSESRKGKFGGENHPMYGKHLPEETRRKISEAHIGKHLSVETRRKMSESRKGKGLRKDNPMFGKHHSEETRRKMSEDRKGENHPMYGKHPSEESRKKMSESHKGKQLGKDNPNYGKHPTPWNRGIPRSEEEKKKMSENSKGITAWNKGKTGVYSEETLQKMSAIRKGRITWMKGKKHSEETRKKIKEKRLEQVFPTKDSKFELDVQDLLREKGIKFEKHKKIKGQPDIFIKPNLCILLDGDFHHANPSKYSDDFVIWRKRISKSSRRYVQEITAKMIWEKDELVNKELRSKGYEIIRIWHSEFKKDPEKCVQEIIKNIEKPSAKMIIQ